MFHRQIALGHHVRMNSALNASGTVKFFHVIESDITDIFDSQIVALYKY
jgi:hypothetical protein